MAVTRTDVERLFTSLQDKMLASPSSGNRETYLDGYAQGLATAVGEVRLLLTELEAELAPDNAHLPQSWQFRRSVPELVVQVPGEHGDWILARIAGGNARAELADAQSRAFARTLLELAAQHLDATEPASTTGHNRP